MVLFSLISYLAISEVEAFEGTFYIAALLVDFGLLAIVDSAIWLGLEGSGS
jgi:hypothetical protein